MEQFTLFKNGKVVYTGESFSGIYALRCNVNNKWYVGQSTNVPSRMKAYLGKWCKGQELILRALNKYNIESFDAYILEKCDNNVLSEREIYWGNILKSMTPTGYNLSLGRKGGRRVFTKEHKENISKAKIGITTWNKGKKLLPNQTGWTDERKKKASLSHIGNKNAVGNTHNRGRTHTAQNKLKISNGIKLTKLIKWLEREAPWFCETT